MHQDEKGKEFIKARKLYENLKNKIETNWFGFLNYIFGVFVLGISTNFVEEAFKGEFTFLEAFLLTISVFLLTLPLIFGSSVFPKEISLARKLYTQYTYLSFFNKHSPINFFKCRSLRFVNEEICFYLNLIIHIDEKFLKDIYNLDKVLIYVVSTISFFILWVISATNLGNYIDNILPTKLFNEDINDSNKVAFYYVIYSMLLTIGFFLLKLLFFSLKLPFLKKILLKIYLAIIFIFSTSLFFILLFLFSIFMISIINNFTSLFVFAIFILLIIGILVMVYFFFCIQIKNTAIEFKKIYTKIL